MLTFKAQFPIVSNITIETFMECCRVWIQNSPHTHLKNTIPTNITEGKFGNDSESATFASHITEIKSTAGVRYEKTDNDGVRWVTDVIGHKSEDQFLVSVQLNADSELPVERLEQGKRPYIIKLLMQQFSGGKDGEIAVTDKPLFLKESDTDLAEKIICAGTGSVLPIVYISRDNSENTIADPHALAKWLSGMAHIIVEPSRKFSAQIMRQVDGENAYGGAIAIYWPDGIGKWLYLPNKWSDQANLQNAIAKKIRYSLLYQRIRRECTWSYLQELVARERLDALRASGSENIDEYIEHFDKEIAAKDEAIQRLEAELVRARYARQLSGPPKNDDDEKSLQINTGENDFYQGEQLGFIIDALRKSSESADDHSRRQQVLNQLIKNNENPGDRDSMLDRLKEILRQYTSMTATVRSDLESMGFSIYEDGKHYKLLLHDDERFPFVLPKTGSDHRGGLNAFSDMKKRLF